MCITVCRVYGGAYPTGTKVDDRAEKRSGSPPHPSACPPQAQGTLNGTGSIPCQPSES